MYRFQRNVCDSAVILSALLRVLSGANISAHIMRIDSRAIWVQLSEQISSARDQIDQSFIQGIADNNDHRLIVQTIISMAKSLNKELVAEGVETVEQAKYLHPPRL